MSRELVESMGGTPLAEEAGGFCIKSPLQPLTYYNLNSPPPSLIYYKTNYHIHPFTPGGINPGRMYPGIICPGI